MKKIISLIVLFSFLFASNAALAHESQVLCYDDTGMGRAYFKISYFDKGEEKVVYDRLHPTPPDIGFINVFPNFDKVCHGPEGRPCQFLLSIVDVDSGVVMPAVVLNMVTYPNTYTRIRDIRPYPPMGYTIIWTKKYLDYCDKLKIFKTREATPEKKHY